jgi:hypothetical protein
MATAGITSTGTGVEECAVYFVERCDTLPVRLELAVTTGNIASEYK